MAVFLAHYRSLDADPERARGLFEFQSQSRMGSKANAHDARIRMLELFGNAALSWDIFKIERKRATEEKSDGQMELDFREPVKKRKRKPKREYW